MKQTFCSLKPPLLVGSIRQRTAEAAIEDIRNGELEGADAFILHIQLMNGQDQHFDAFREIAASTDRPMMALYYKTEDGAGDEQRLSIMKEAVKAGFGSVDIPMYMYDDDAPGSLESCGMPFAAANPGEVSMRPEVIRKQKELIQEFHDRGAEVLMSAHVGVELSVEQAAALALEIESRNADMVKIITDCQSAEQQIEILRTNLALKKLLKVPFICTCSGKYSRFIRLNAPLFGSMLVFGHHEYGELANRDKPLLKDVRELHRIMKKHP
ncbi:MAG: type 3-dehydroquinate dehydratase [Paenibacillaceae bacterium]|jgi:3-dehydroquinate dehydratase|nr:type 3-dehydroquinate dehydratase [Paenibacillaceae bacterium]